MSQNFDRITSGSTNFVFDRVAKERHGRGIPFIDRDRAFRHVSLPKFSSSSCLIRRLIRPAWKLSRLRRTGVCLTELNGAYDRPFKAPDTAKAYRFRGNAKSAFSIRCDFPVLKSPARRLIFLCIFVYLSLWPEYTRRLIK